MFNTQERHVQEKVNPSGQPLSLDNGKRFVNMVVGGALQEAGLVMSAEAAQDDKLGEQVKVAFVDTDANNLEGVQPKNKFLMDQIPAAALLDAIEKQPSDYPGSRILGDLEQIWRALGAAEQIASGLLTRRILGLFVFWYVLLRRSQALRNFLLHSVRELHQAYKCTCWQAQHTTQKALELTVSYFFSSCGGTGSSLAMLVQDMQRYLLSTDSGLRPVKFTADILLPGAMLHRATDPQALKANTYAFLLELMERYYHRLPVLQLGTNQVPQSHRPFQEIYLYDEMNTQKRIFANREALNDVVQQVWKLRNLGPEGQAYQSRKVDYHLEVPDICSSGGCCNLVFPLMVIETRCALRSGLAWLGDYPLHSPDQEAQGHVRGFLNQTPRFRDIAPFTRDAAGRPIRMSLAELQHLPRQTLSEAIDTFAHRRVPPLQQILNELAEREVTELGTALVSYVSRLLNQRGGPILAAQFLSELALFLQERKSLHEGQVTRMREQRERQARQVERYHAQAWWQHLSATPRKDYLAHRERLLVSQLDERRQLTRLSVVTRLLQLVETLHAECTNWMFTLTTFKEHLEKVLGRQIEEALAKRSVVEEWVVCVEEMDEMYQVGQEQALREAASGLKFTWQSELGAFQLTYGLEEPDSTTTWTINSDTGVAKHVSYFRRFWTSIREYTVEGILTKQGKAPEEVLTWLLTKAAPLIQIDDTTQIPAEKMLNILGSQTQTFWQGFMGKTGLSLVETKNPHRISLLSTLQGFNPLDGLMQSQAWKQAYEDTLAAGRSPHLFPDSSLHKPLVEPFLTNSHPKPTEEQQEVSDGIN